MPNEVLASISEAVNWFFNTAAALGTIQHNSYLWIDAGLVASGMLMARPAGAVGRRVYTRVKGMRARLE